MSNIFEREMQKETVFSDRNKIVPSYIPEKLPFRGKQIDEISKILAVLLKGKKANNLFIYGKTGTGKTSTVKHVFKDLGEFVGKNNLQVHQTYVNCRNHSSKYKVLIKAIKQFCPEESFLGFSYGFIHDKLLEFLNKGKHAVIVLDEIDKLKDLDELVYSITRTDDELSKGSVSVIGISNSLRFKERLDPRTKSSLCEKEMVFPPYNAEELKAILKERARLGFKKGVVQESALSLASAYAAQESGDARTAVMLLLRAGELADEKGLKKVSDEEVKKAKKKVEEEIIFNMISTLPDQQQLVLKAIAELTMTNKGIRRLTGKDEAGVFYSGDIYEKYRQTAKKIKISAVSARWYRQYISELEMLGLILVSASGPGIKGQTKLIKLGCNAKKISDTIERELMN